MKLSEEMIINGLDYYLPKVERLENDKEEMLEALIEILKGVYVLFNKEYTKYKKNYLDEFYKKFANEVKLIEKHTGKKWEDINEI